MAVFFDKELEGVATFWRVFRSDGVAIGLTSHDRSLFFGGITHRAAPGIAPSAIRKTTGFAEESAQVEGALCHSSISERDLNAGLYDGAMIEIGAVNWETLEHTVLYTGEFGEIFQGNSSFSVELRSAKRQLERDIVSYTSPTCRAEFCGPGCNLSVAHFLDSFRLTSADIDENSIIVTGLDPANYVGGRMTFLEGPQTGITFGVIARNGDALILDRPLHKETTAAMRVRMLQSCDHTHATCHSRFNNAVNFRGEPFLPGNDLLTRYPKPQ